MTAPSLSSMSATKSRKAPMVRPHAASKSSPNSFSSSALAPSCCRPRLFEPLAKRVEGLHAGGLGRPQPGVQHEIGELALLLEAAEDGADLADDQLEHRDLFLQQRQHLLLQRAARDQIEDEDLAVLADAVDAADALLDRHRVPGHVEIDQGIAELDVAPFAARLRAQQDRRMVAKRGDGRVLLRPAQAPVEARERHTPAFARRSATWASVSREWTKTSFFSVRLRPTRSMSAASLPPVVDRRPSVGEFEPKPDRRRFALRSAPARSPQRPWARSLPRQEMMQGQPFAPCPTLCRQPPRGRREVGIGLRLPRRAVDLDGRGVAPRQLEGDDGAGVANHRAAHERAQSFGIGRLARLARRHIGEREIPSAS